MTKLKTIGILGCGWFGFPLALRLIEGGYLVRGSTTSDDKFEMMRAKRIVPYLVRFNPEYFSDKGEEFFECDVLLVNIPPRNNGEKYKRQVDNIAELVGKHKIKMVILISSTSVYGEVCREVDEDFVPIPETEVGKALQYSELKFLSLKSAKTVVVRFAGLIGPGRDPGSFFAGKADVANGRAPVNLIHLNDAIGIVEAVLKDDSVGGIINACSPDHPSRQRFYTLAAKASNLPLPVFKDELIKWKIISSRSSGTKLEYQYKIIDWVSWLNESLS